MNVAFIAYMSFNTITSLMQGSALFKLLYLYDFNLIKRCQRLSYSFCYDTLGRLGLIPDLFIYQIASNMLHLKQSNNTRTIILPLQFDVLAAHFQ